MTTKRVAIIVGAFVIAVGLLIVTFGEVKDFGTFVSGSVNIHNSNGDATLSLKVIGERRTVNATVDLIYRDGRQRRVTAASFRNEAGQAVDLLNAYEVQKQLPLLVA